MNTESITARKFPKWAKIVSIVLGSLFVLLVLLWLLAGWYVNSHKEALLKKITTYVSEHLDGQFKIGDMQPALFKGFPDVSLELEDVSLGDSLIGVHHRNLFQFESVFAKFNLFSMLSGHPHITKMTLKNGQINLFTDSSGYTNSYLLNKKNRKKKTSPRQMEVSAYQLENILFTFDHKPKNKKIQFLIVNSAGAVKHRGQMAYIVAPTEIHINQLGFNLAKGGYLVNKEFKSKLHLSYDRQKGILHLPFQAIRINQTNLKVGADFQFKTGSKGFTIIVESPSIAYKEAVSYLSRSIADKIQKFNLAKAISLQVSLKGKFQYPDTPLVHARWQTTKNDFQTNFGELKDASFAGEFNNEIYPGKGRGDANSAITVNHLSANYMDIPIVADSIRLFNLLHPLLDFKMTSGFPVQRLNTALSHTFNFTKGSADLKVDYHGGISTHDSLGHSIVGGLKIKDAAFTYVPHNVHFSEGNIDLDFNGADLIINNSTLSTGKSDMQLHGIAKQFLNVYFDDPQKAAFEWYLHSDTLNLAEFKGLMQQRQIRSPRQQRRQHHRVNERLAYLMEKSRMKVHASIDRLYYSSFTASQVKGDLEMDENSIVLDPLSMNFADGSLEATLKMEPGSQDVPFNLNANLAGINTSKLFYGLENLGQSTLTSKNIAGQFSGKINIGGRLNNQSDIVKNSLNGKASFKLTGGQLINFAPFKSIQKFVFKKRDLSHIAFAPVSNVLTIKNGKVNIPQMDIASSVINLSIQGIYAFGPGTDLGIVVPLRNPKKKAERAAKGLKPRKNKGIVLHLRAVDGKDGKVKIVWDPLRKGPDEDTAEDE
ncbi:MAG TPA: AsmA-like C-terminal region-containing protein [Arachidicoccus sp.]|nr:AsmA-like C-terminal region-containing protein [Arachidicoccus sp.]